MSKKYKSFLCTCINAWDNVYFMLFNLYWMYVSKTWYYFSYVFGALGMISLFVFVLVVPDSPKQLYM